MSALIKPSMFRRLLQGVVTKPWSIAAGPLTLGLLLDKFNSSHSHPCEEAVDICSELCVRELGSSNLYTYSIVTPDKNDPENGDLSCCSPLGFALLGKRAGEQVTVRALLHDLHFFVENVRCRETVTNVQQSQGVLTKMRRSNAAAYV